MTEEHWRELVESSDRHASHARRYIDAVTPQFDPVMDLPLARGRTVYEAPRLETTASLQCPSRACRETAMLVVLGPVLRTATRCALRRGHWGAHMRPDPRQTLEGWQVDAWEQTAPAAKDDLRRDVDVRRSES